MIAPGIERIVTTADDLGESEATNEEIYAGMADGLLTSATILASGEAPSFRTVGLLAALREDARRGGAGR